MEIRVSVRQLVEFILREGNIDNRRTGGSDTAMQEGGRIHRMIQRRMGSDYHAEVMLRHVWKTLRLYNTLPCRFPYIWLHLPLSDNPFSEYGC